VADRAADRRATEAGGPPTVAAVGEFGLIKRVTEGRVQPASTLLGPGDDAAMVAAPDGRVLASTDVLVEGVHFRFDWSSPEQVGRKAAAVNMADIAAMGATPTALLVGLGCPSDTSTAVAEELAAGLWAEAAAVGAGVVGGDVVSASQVVLSITVLGDLRGRDPVTRSGARPGDVLAVAGRLGWAAAEAGATSMIDTSDGLLADLGHIAAASGVTLDVRSEDVPLAPRLVEVAAALGADPRRWTLTGGEDHALAATFPPGASLPEGFVVIGTVAEGSGVTVDGRPYDGTAGWDHFASG
jgi:thiamine-monophosphate kinase